MKSVYKILSLALAAALLAVSLCACGAAGNKGGVKKAVEKFEAALQAGDTSAMLDAYDPQVSGPIKATMALLGVSEEKINELITNALGSSLMDSVKEYGDKAGNAAAGILKSIKIKIVDYAFNSEGDRCTVTVKYEFGGGDKPLSLDGTLKCVLRDDVWYIALI